MTKLVIAAIFAHPDDESMGPGGTLAKLAKTCDVYLICATQGEKGGNAKNLGKRRYGELLRAARILGIKEVIGFKFPDGELSNGYQEELATKFEGIIEKYHPHTLITFEPRGLTGHQDHITVTMVVSHLFDKLSYVKKLMLYCMGEKQSSLMDDYFIPVPPGYTKNQIDYVENVKATWEKKKKAIACHESQKGDVVRVLSELDQIPPEEYFLVRTK